MAPDPDSAPGTRWQRRYDDLAARLPGLAERARPVLCGLGACVDVYARLERLAPADVEIVGVNKMQIRPVWDGQQFQPTRWIARLGVFGDDSPPAFDRLEHESPSSTAACPAGTSRW